MIYWYALKSDYNKELKYEHQMTHWDILQCVLAVGYNAVQSHPSTIKNLNMGR